MTDNTGAVCLHGAIRACTPQIGDAEIVRAVARQRGFTENWNDEKATEGEVLDALESLTVTDADLAETFGPHGFTQEAYQTLVSPGAGVIGKVHPDD